MSFEAAMALASSTWAKMNHLQGEEILALRAERDALRRDAERYRWLRDVDAQTQWHHVDWTGDPEDIDAAIDAAMKESK